MFPTVNLCPTNTASKLPLQQTTFLDKTIMLQNPIRYRPRKNDLLMFPDKHFWEGNEFVITDFFLNDHGHRKMQ